MLKLNKFESDFIYNQLSARNLDYKQYLKEALDENDNDRLDIVTGMHEKSRQIQNKLLGGITSEKKPLTKNELMFLSEVLCFRAPLFKELLKDEIDNPSQARFFELCKILTMINKLNDEILKEWSLCQSN